MKNYLLGKEHPDVTKLFLRKMKITCLMLLMSVSSIFASHVKSQVAKVNITAKNTSINSVLKEIEQQTDYLFVYNKKEVDLDRKIDVTAQNLTVAELLSGIFEHTNVIYAKEGDNIMLIYKDISNQELTVKGKITDTEGTPLPGVNIVEKGTTNGAVTDLDGNYSIAVSSSEAILSFSFVGYLTEEVEVAGQTQIDLTLVEDILTLDEVVVIGYGTMKKSDLTGSITSISSEDLVAFPSVGIDQAMQGRATGVQITSLNGEPGAGVRIRIRGGTSINASSDPLYVVDGFAGGIAPPPEDIASIEILKDASATAIYGSRGANGVILITTKSGKKGETVFEFNSSYSFEKIEKKLDLLNATEFAEFYNEVIANSGSSNIPFPNPASYGVGTDWQDVIYRNGNLQNYQLSASGGKENIKYYTSINYYNQEGIVINSDYKRFSGLTNLEINTKKNLKFGTRMFFRRSVESGIKTQEKANSTGVISAILNTEPTLGIYEEDGSYAISKIGDAKDNPYAVVKEYVDEPTNDLFQGSGYGEWTITDGLVFKSTFGVNIRNYRTGNYIPTTLTAGENVGGDADISSNKITSILNENYLSYNKTINDIHKLNLMAGYSYQSYRNESWIASNRGFITDTYLYWNLDGGTDYQNANSNLTEWEMLSYYGRANYNFNDKYLLTFTGRYDGSSRFGLNNKWAFFPSGAFAWNISQEPFLQSVEDISHLKLRVSYGITGNTDIGIYKSLANFSSTSAIHNDTPVNAVIPSTVANNNLSWESTKQTDIGLDFGLWKERVIITADYYSMITDDLLYELPLPEYSGYTTSLRNIGSVENNGFELGLSTVNVQNESFNWTSDFNISSNRNKVSSLPGGEFTYRRAPGHFNADDDHILTEGSPVGAFYGRIYEGVNKADGSPVYKDIAGRDADNNLIMEPDGVVNNDDRTIIGDPNPDFIFGLTNTFKYKNFDLNIFFQGVVGNDIYNFTRMEIESVNGMNNQLATVLNRWTPSNTDTDIPVASNSYGYRSSSRWVEDGTYIRLKNLSLGYNINKTLLNGTGIDKVRLYVSGQNLFTTTDYQGYNPDVSYRDDNYSLGSDYCLYPNTRRVTFGVNLVF